MAPRNAADEEQLKKQEELDKRLKEEQLADLRDILSTESGRRFIWRLMEKTKAFGTLWAASSEIYKNVATADIGKWLFQECQKADLASLMKIMSEYGSEKDA